METTGQVNNRTVSIASGESLSGAIYLGGIRLFGLVMPSTWTTANLTFQVSVDGTTYQNLYDGDGTEVQVTTAAGYTHTLDPALFAAIPFVKVRSGTSGTPVNQGGDRTIGLILRSV